MYLTCVTYEEFFKSNVFGQNSPRPRSIYSFVMAMAGIRNATVTFARCIYLIMTSLASIVVMLRLYGAPEGRGLKKETN